jgi:drug/metabolite transporter (DMT)-like permease
MSSLPPAKQPVDPAPGPFQDPPVEPAGRHPMRNLPWFGGAVLIFIGVIFLVKDIPFLHLDNWWALFILIPAFTSLASAWTTYRRQQRITSAVRGPLIGGIILICVALIFLFNLDFGRYWPVFLIVAGLGTLIGALIKDKETES